MSLVVPPRGTRGSELPSFARALMRVMQGLFHMAFRQFGDRVRVQGRPLVELETVGAKSGSRRQAGVGSFPEIAAAGTFQLGRGGLKRWIGTSSRLVLESREEPGSGLDHDRQAPNQGQARDALRQETKEA